MSICTQKIPLKVQYSSSQYPNLLGQIPIQSEMPSLGEPYCPYSLLQHDYLQYAVPEAGLDRRERD